MVILRGDPVRGYPDCLEGEIGDAAEEGGVLSD